LPFTTATSPISWQCAKSKQPQEEANQAGRETQTAEGKKRQKGEVIVARQKEKLNSAKGSV